jgi:pimeloyl-ACP methyl ester carboxylesterase
MNSTSTSSGGDRPTIVFVHGAWADASGFDGSIRALHNRGYRTIGVANPLRGLGGDAAYLGALLQTVEGPMVLVAHSYGGAVISNAATGNDQVKALVFLAGWALDEGESIEQLLGLNEGSLVLPALRQVPFTNPDGSEGVTFISIRRRSRPFLPATSTSRRHASWRPPSARGALRRSARRPGRRRGSRSPPGIWSAPRTRRSLRRRSASWLSGQRRPSRRSRLHTPPWFRSRT